MCAKPLVLIAAGGSGGHVIPAQALADQLMQLGYRVHFAGADLSRNRFFSRTQFSFSDIESRPLSLSKCAQFSVGCVKGLFQGVRLIRSLDPAVVVGFGSYHTVSVLLSSFACRIPLILHEANGYPGRVIQLFSRYAEVTGCYFASAQKKLAKGNLMGSLMGNAILTDIPLRQEIMLYEKVSKEDALSRYGLAGSTATVLVLGGSQGARGVNAIAPKVIAGLARRMGKSALQVIHIAGDAASADQIRAEYVRLQGAAEGRIKASVLAYEPQMEYALRAADGVIARSGAGTIAELAFVGLPALFIPYPNAKDDHQMVNAVEYCNATSGASVVYSEQELLENSVQEKAAGALFDRIGIRMRGGRIDRVCLCSVVDQYIKLKDL